MYSRRRLIHFFTALLFLTLLGYWMLHGIRREYLLQMDSQRLQTAKSAMVNFSADNLSSWLEGLNRSVPACRVIYLSGDPSQAVVPAQGDNALSELYRANADNPDFVKGYDNVAYGESYFSSVLWTFGEKNAKVLFLPVPEGTEGLMLFAFDLSDQNEFLRLLYFFFTAAFAALLAALWIILFSRDIITAFAVVGLFSISLLFVAYPLFEAVRLTFFQEGRLTLSVWKSILTSSRHMAALKGSIELGFWTATFSTLLGFIFAFVCTRTTVRFKPFIAAMGTLPVISPPFSLTLSIILLFGNNGLFTRTLGLTSGNFTIYGLKGLVLAQTVGMFPIAFLTLSGVLEAIDSTFEDAALNLAASKWRTFSSVTLPLALPGLLSAWLLVFTNSLADFANPLILAGGFHVLSLEAYIEVTGMNRLGHGAALSLLLLLPTLTAFLAQRFWVARKSYVTVTGKPSGRITELTTPPVRFMLLSVVAAMIAFLFLLYGTIIAGCFVKNWGIDYSFSLVNITEALTRGYDALVDTVTLAGIATPLAGIIAMIAALAIVRKSFYGKRILEILIMTPFALPGTLIGISYILAFNRPPLILVGTAAIIVINYIVRELPVGVEGGVVALRQIDPSIEEAATDLGADSATVFRTVVLPLIRPAFISSLSYTFVRSMTAVSAVIFLISASWNHLTVLIYNFSENLRFGLASVLSTVLILIVFAAFGMMRLLVRKNENLLKNINNV